MLLRASASLKVAPVITMSRVLTRSTHSVVLRFQSHLGCSSSLCVIVIQDFDLQSATQSAPETHSRPDWSTVVFAASPFAAMNDLANRVGAWVASSPGAMPPLPELGLRQSLMRLGLFGSRVIYQAKASL